MCGENMKKIASWDRVFDFIELFILSSNIYFRMRYWSKGGQRAHNLKANSALHNIHKGHRAFVIGTGTSVTQQNIRNLRDEITFFVNRGFLHDDYAYIKPDYHIFIDPKLASGEWPLTFLDEIAELNPNVTFLLRADWIDLPEFQEYSKKYRIYWVAQNLFFPKNYYGDIDLTTIGPGGAVVEQGVVCLYEIL